MTILFDLIFIIGLLFYLPLSMIRRKYHSGLWKRFGIFSKEIRKALAEKENIWIHAVSVGEVMAVLKLVEVLREKYPDSGIVVSTVTRTGYDLAVSRLKGKAVVVFAPFDLSFAVRRYIREIAPKIYIAAETEIWPNLFTFLNRACVPIIQVNGRISAESFRGYRRIGFLIRKVLSRVDVFCMQGERDVARLLDLGVDPSKIVVTGSMKFDDLPGAEKQNPGLLGLQPDDILWIAGSTHPGEEEVILNVYRKLRLQFKQLRLVIAPRHIERIFAVAKQVRIFGFHPVRFSKSKDSALDKSDVVIVDTIGHLRTLYSFADIVFVGKSLVGQGGQNIIEPAAFSKPILTGPHMQNFQGIFDAFLVDDAVICVRDESELFQQVENLLKNPQTMREVGDRARSVIEKNRGATQKTAEIISRLI